MDNPRFQQSLRSINAGMRCDSPSFAVKSWPRFTRVCYMKVLAQLIVLIGVLSRGALAQTPQPMPPGPPFDTAGPLLGPVNQADENFCFLRDPAKRTDLWDFLKYIPLNHQADVYLTFGFEN